MDVVFHTAAVADIWGPWEHFYSINVQGTLNILQACQAAGVRKLVFTSSPSVTFDGTDQCGVDETAPYPQRWLCHYPHTKALAEQAVLAANGRQGTLTCALRPHLIWGPRDGHLVPRLIDRARRGRLRQVGDGKNLVDMIYVENAAQAHLQAADALEAHSPVAGRAYFISQGEPVRCWDWIDAVLALSGLPPVRRRISATAARRVGGALETIFRLLRIEREPIMTRFLAAQLATSHYFSDRTCAMRLRLPADRLDRGGHAPARPVARGARFEFAAGLIRPDLGRFAGRNTGSGPRHAGRSLPCQKGGSGSRTRANCV